jgi:hypothetical protein
MKKHEQELAEELAALTEQINAAEADLVRQAAIDRLSGYSSELRMMADGLDQILRDLLGQNERDDVQVPLPGYHPDAKTEVVNHMPDSQTDDLNRPVTFADFLQFAEMIRQEVSQRTTILPQTASVQFEGRLKVVEVQG